MTDRTLPASPLAAACKSLVLPGLGQWHNGQIDKAAWWFLAFAGVSVPGIAAAALWVPAAWTAPMLALGLLLAIGLWAGAVVDAWRTARRAGPSHTPPPVWRMAGVTLLLIVLCDLVTLPLVIGAVRTHLVQAFRIPSASMAPTLWPGDFVFADMRYACVACRAPVRRGDVVIFANPNDRTLLYVKRVVALPGDRVVWRGSEVHVNGEAVPPASGPMPKLDAPPLPAPPSARTPDVDEGVAFVVPQGRVFALGDRREASADSRSFGTVPLQDVVGKVRQIWFSWGGPDGVRWERIGRTVP